MKTSKSSMRKAGPGFTGLLLFSVVAGAGSASADTYQHGGSTATIEQSGSGSSRSEVTRYKDGQKIVTKNGNSTDITIQGGSGSPAPDYGWGYPYWGDDPFDSQRIEERFSRGADSYSRSSLSSEREAFKQQMLDRMRSGFRP
jgi:hypothetical protein